MSLSSIKEREAKGKKKVLPKLRTVLANPYKQHSPVLTDDEVLEFRQILEKAKKSSEETDKSFVTRHGIHLGLESSLRAINSQRFSCLLISLSLRPAHLIRLIATSASVKVPTAPIYAQPKLEELTQEIFGVRSISLALPLDLKGISEDLERWVNARKRSAPSPKTVTPIVTKSHRKRKEKATIPQKSSEELKPAIPAAPEKKDWGDDFISCSSDKASLKLDQVDVQVETQQLGAALSHLAMKAKGEQSKDDQKPEKREKSPSVEPMEVDTEAVVDEDDFLPSNLHTYRPLTVHQIRPNPDKKPKKKRNKKQKQPPSNSSQ
ncbi:uncharacterized protein [Drosophila kikkawai]|uniref:Uncharacterized protein n=1 Tax=Drosophila kikkawai TaxID=30033 RepID=A0A6P4IF09_DROKI|nr:uncharacterized protein LOC108077835 [Drosophila kikkawai]